MVISKDGRAVELCDPKKEGAPEFIKHHIVLPDKLFGSGRLYSILRIPAGSQVPNHQHVNEFEIYLILSGEGDYNDNGNIVRLGPGDVAVCPDGETHGIVNDGPEELVFAAFIGYPNPSRQ